MRMNFLKVAGATQDRPFKPIGITPGNVLNLSAPLAKKMVMMPGAFNQFIECMRVLKIHFSNHADFDQRFQCPVNSGGVQCVPQLHCHLGKAQRFAALSEDLQEGDPPWRSLKPSAVQHFFEALLRGPFHKFKIS